EGRRLAAGEAGMAGGGGVARPVVLRLVVVEGDQPRRGGVRRLQVGVAFVLGVPQPVVGQRDACASGVLAHPPRRGAVAAGAVLVYVVAQVHDQVGVVFGDAAVGG